MKCTPLLSKEVLLSLDLYWQRVSLRQLWLSKLIHPTPGEPNYSTTGLIAYIIPSNLLILVVNGNHPEVDLTLNDRMYHPLIKLAGVWQSDESPTHGIPGGVQPPPGPSLPVLLSAPAAEDGFLQRTGLEFHSPRLVAAEVTGAHPARLQPGAPRAIPLAPGARRQVQQHRGRTQAPLMHVSLVSRDWGKGNPSVRYILLCLLGLLRHLLLHNQ